ncbi:phophatase 2C family protein [Pterulicium gracile]|uniref:Phophatase 2C family protein n=1 Tax=Pterulicium gracile TaxID=1884261 RepID=A0A5C3QAR2_9AGAR|nr:phophatase 2C family protein [Pterula gracilis]
MSNISKLRAYWKPLTALTLPATALAVYSTYTPTFDLPVRVKNPDTGKREMVSQAFPLLPQREIERRLHENEKLEVHERVGVTWRQATASLASNDPIEDRSAQAVVKRDVGDAAGEGDYLFFSVFDGHSGFFTSQLLSKILINALVLDLAKLSKGDLDKDTPGSTGFLSKLNPWSSSTAGVSAGGIAGVLRDGNPAHVAQVLRDAYTKLDAELVKAPLVLLANNIPEASKKANTVPDLSEHPLALPTMLPAISGACALTAVFDIAHRDLYVASTGDCRAVAGIWQENADGSGSWKCDVLSEDQTGRNPREIERIQAQHPADEADTVIMNGRVLGGLEPTRAFGDARYKWPRHVQEALSTAFLEGNGRPIRPPPKLFKTPPYVTATPEVTHRKLHLPTTVPIAPISSESPAQKETLRFIVLATDGLFDALSSEEVVSLVGGHLQGLKGHIPKSELRQRVRLSDDQGALTVEGKPYLERDASQEKQYWAFTDENPGTHLIRNALGGGTPAKLAKMMSIPSPHSRRYRDDITVTVVWWEEGKARVEEVDVKAKL